MVSIRTKAPLAALASALVLSGCTTMAPRSAESTLDGQWTDAQGVAVSTFSNGQFVSIANDTGNRLSEGTYHLRDSRNVEISMRSLIRETQTTVNCSIVTSSQLNCTNAQGQNFVLRRRGVS